ncbi:hypothetical protein BJX63DRAFT_399322 [Aspergillus granulosus]|uniref:Telomeric single stranded DNA binding POT1/Cdc13 domain-containing protein n=1 Tax=Aspergillus granulosus TaxID=176169 RepID=A0ABR4H7E1_9EURO
MNTDDQPPSSEALRSTAIPIAQLSTDVDILAEKSIHSVVTLLWPYSSSTKSLGLLLAEPDFRLRRLNGQVKVLFHGHVAEEVAKSHVGIGDKVYLSLAGSRLMENNAVAQTPGSRSAYELHFDASAFFEVWRDSKLLSVVQVDRSSSPPASADIPATPRTPGLNGSTYTAGPLDSASWQSPAFFERSRKSFGLADITFDPFEEEDGYVPGKGRKRPRFSMRSNEWRVIDERESPGEKDLPDWTVIFDEELATNSDADEERTSKPQDAGDSGTSPRPEAVVSGPASENADVAMVDSQPIVSEVETEQSNDGITDNANLLRPDNAPKSNPETTRESDTSEIAHLSTNTPRLHPIPSPGLPDPSPLVTSNSPSGYFIPVPEADVEVQSITPLVSASEVISEPGEPTTPPQIQSDSEAVQIDEDDAVTVYTDDVQVLPDSISPSGRTLSSPQVSGSKDVKSAPVADQQPDEPMEESSPPAELDATEAAMPVVYSDESDSESERQIEGEQDEEAEVDVWDSEKEDEPQRDEQSPGRQSQELEDESDKILDTKCEVEEEEGEAARAPEGEGALLARKASYSSDESRGASEEPVQLYEDEAEEAEEVEDEMDRSDEGADYEVEYEGEYEEDYDEEELEDKPQYEYYGSGSEVETDYEEEPQPRSAPKSAEPEIIVLDSESEDELSTQHPDDMARRKVEEYSDGSYDSENQDDLEEEIYDEPDLVGENDDPREDMESPGDLDVEVQDKPNQDYDEIEEDQESDDDQGQEYVMEDQPDNEGVENNRPPIYERRTEDWGSTSEHLDRDVHDEDPREDLPKPVQDRSDVEIKETPTELPANPEKQLTLDEPPAAYGYFEDFYATAAHPHGSLDYLAAISESAGRMEGASETVQQVGEMAIDPSLYTLDSVQNELAPETGTENHPSGPPMEASRAPLEPPESNGARDLALQLDGASPEMLDKTLKPANEPPSTPASRTIVVSEQGSPSLTVRVKAENTENSLGGSEQEIEREPKASMVIVDAPEPTLSDEGQKLQASIEVDHETEADIDTAHISPVNKHYPGLRSKLSYFAPLATLIDHYNALVDTICIASEVQPVTKATSGKKDFILILQLTDPSMAGTTIYAQILRPYKSALPSLQEGDAILLRNFRVTSFNHSVILVSDSTSAWAVYSTSEDPEVNGPPVELSSEEKTFATDLRQWYLEGGMAMVADYQLQASIGRESRDGTPTSSFAQSDAGDIDMALREARGDTSSSRGSRRRKSHRRITIHELRDGRRYTEVGSSPGEGSIHELRDGTVYANL